MFVWCRQPALKANTCARSFTVQRPRAALGHSMPGGLPVAHRCRKKKDGRSWVGNWHVPPGNSSENLGFITVRPCMHGQWTIYHWLLRILFLAFSWIVPRLPLVAQTVSGRIAWTESSLGYIELLGALAAFTTCLEHHFAVTAMIANSSGSMG